jgi:hypothetical protein
LGLLAFFDLVRDCFPCFMHMVPVIFKGHLLQLLKGRRTPAVVRPAANMSDAENAAVAESRDEVALNQAEWEIRPNDPRAILLDTRSQRLGAGKARWIRAGMMVTPTRFCRLLAHAPACTEMQSIYAYVCVSVFCCFQIYKDSAALTSKDWHTIAGPAGEYIFYNLFAGFDEKKQVALDKLLEACSAVTHTIAPINDPGSEARLRELKLQVLEAMCIFEREVPSSEHCIMSHNMSHMADHLHRYNSVRNTWSFLSERIMGYLVRFVNNRNYAVENVCAALERQRLLMAVPGDVMEVLAQKLRMAGVKLPEHSLLNTESVKTDVSRHIHLVVSILRVCVCVCVSALLIFVYIHVYAYV